MNTKPNRTPAKWSDLDAYLKPAHLGGKQFTLTLTRITFDEMHPRPGVTEIKPVARFKETDKGLILTSTNQDFLREVFGDEIGACFGQRVTVKAETVRVGGRDVETIRLGEVGTAPKAEPTNNAELRQAVSDAEALWGEEPF